VEETAAASIRESPLSGRSQARIPLSVFGLCALPIALGAAMVLATLYGTVSVAPGVVLNILAYKLGLHIVGTHYSTIDESLVWSIRLPRVVAAALVGAALAVAGTLFQGVLRNPLADPYVIGTSAGAQLGVAISLAVPAQFVVLGFGSIQAGAFIGAVVTVAFVYGLAHTAGRTPVVTLLLAGFVVSSFLISATSFLMITTNRVNQVTLWTMGGIDISRYQQLAFTGPCVLLGVCLATIMAPRLDVILLGEEQATHLGIRVERVKVVAILLGSLLTGLAVALAGVVAFVGLVVPHAARLIFGPSHRTLVPAAAFGGAAFVVLVDLIARTVVAPTEIPLGIMTAVVGAPFFLHLLRRTRRTYDI
jgi:iron complex transport system permease protein